MSKILIADDEPQIREILRVYFNKDGFVTVTIILTMEMISISP